LWAKRHIDELLKSGDEFKDEIVSLSKQYYVVTPHTSLIVLENDAMYEEYKVERGRKDHWALYPAPKEIEVVKEPADWNRWGWWGGFAGEDGKVEANSKPQSVEEIVESVQFRINAPFYYLRPQQPNDGRYTLYQLTDSESDPAKMLTLLYILAGGKPLPVEPQAGANANAGPPVAGEPVTSMPMSGPEPMRQQIGQSIDGFFHIPATSRVPRSRTGRFMFGVGINSDTGLSGQIVIREQVLDFQQQGQGGGGPGRGLGLPIELQRLDVGSRFITQLGFDNGAVNGIALTNEFMLDKDFERLAEDRFDLFDRESRLALLPNLSQKAPASSMLPGNARPEGYPFDLGIAPPLMQSYRQAIHSRWSRIEGDIKSFNSMYSHWGWQDNWNTLDLRRSGSVRWYGGLEGLLDGSDQDRVVELNAMFRSLKEISDVQPVADMPVPVEESFRMPLMPSMGELRNRKRALMPQAQLAMFSQAMNTLPGTCAVLAVDHLVPRREALKNEGEEKAREWKLTDFAIDSLDSASARLENSGPFWSHQGWNYRPQAATVQLPKVQAYPNYNWSFDLTRYAGGLYSTEFDILNEIAEQYGTAAPAGKVSDQARQRIEQARAAIAPVRIRFHEEGPELLAAAGDRFAYTQQSDMYLRDQMICDGQQIVNAYAELGLTARRKATPARLSGLRSLAPHFMPPAGSRAGRLDIGLAGSDEELFTLRLTPVGQTEESETQIELLITAGNDGLIRSKTLLIDGERQFQLAFTYADGNVKLRWLDKENEQVAEASYAAEPLSDVEIAASPFAIELDGQVVIDMPLRRPSYYADQLTQLEGQHTTDQFVSLNRHFALASIQQLERRRWGQTNPEAQNAMTNAIAALERAGRKVLLGDITLLGSAGAHNLLRLADGKTDVAKTHPVYRYSQQREISWTEAKDLSEKHGDSLVGHLAGYHAATQNDVSLDAFLEKYENSPLLLAAAYFRGSWGSDPASMLKLLDNPRWQGLAIMLTAQNLATPEQRAQWAEAFKAWHDKYREAGYDMAIPQHLVAQLKQHNGGKLWRKIVQSKWNLVKEQEGKAPLLAFAEQAIGWGENELANEALALFDERTEDDDSLLLTLAKGQALWAGGRPGEALKEYEQILNKLEAENVAASPALLASVARLAQQTGDHGRAIDLEEQALAAEHPYLPDMINLQAFRRRYHWLWQQYQAKVQEAVDANNEEAVAHWLTRAEATWQRWFEVDRENAGMVQQMATLQATAGRDEAAWLYLSTLVDQKPKDADSYYHVGRWYLGRGEPETAQQFYATAFTWDTANPRWLVERAAVLNSMGRGREARKLYQQVINGDWAPGLQGYVNQAREALK